MSYKRENSKILKLKFLKQDYLNVKKEQKEGEIEIKKAVAHFRHKIDPNAAEDFDKLFYGQRINPPNNSSSSSDLEVSDESKSESEDAKVAVNTEKPTWAKKLYKSIVSRTHPDKYINFPVEEIKQKYHEVYMDAVEAWKTLDWKSLIVCGYEVDIEVDSQEAKEIINRGLEEYLDLISVVKKDIGFHWYHLKEKERYLILENYLKQSGFSFTKEKVVEVVQNLRRDSLNRKTGQRPAKKIGVKRPKRS